MTGRLDGMACLVTGGAAGIGEATARRFIAEGAQVLLTDIAEEKAAAVAADIGATFRRHDVADEADWRGAVDAARAAFGRLDVVVNNAGMFLGENIETMDVANFRRVLDVNLVGVAIGCREAIRVMKDNPGGPNGSIVNISSITGFVGLASGAAYTASKGGVRLLTKSVAVHCAREYRTIRCNSVHPGVIDTAMNQAAFDASDDPEAMRSMFAGIQPHGRMIEPEEIAAGVLYLASDDASSTNGVELLIDGGWLAAPNPL